MGMVFMCSSKTTTNCFHYKILGLPAYKQDQVPKVFTGMRLFLFDVDLRLMYGISKAAGSGGYNIEPKAFKLEFPSQVFWCAFMQIKQFMKFMYDKLKLKKILQPLIIASILVVFIGCKPFLKGMSFTPDAPLYFFTESCLILGML